MEKELKRLQLDNSILPEVYRRRAQRAGDWLTEEQVIRLRKVAAEAQGIIPEMVLAGAPSHSRGASYGNGREPICYHDAMLVHHTADDSWRWHFQSGGECKLTPLDCGCKECGYRKRGY